MSPFDRPKRRQFGQTWWGKQWVEAVEQRAALDSGRLARGRTYARWNYVGALQVDPGVVRARVAGSRATPYHTFVKVAVFTDAQWDAFLDVVSKKIAHAAALIDGELTSELVEDANAADIELLPTAGDLDMGCSCPDDAETCKHSAAVCFLIADLLDDDPFALLHMRGRTKEEVVEALRLRRHRTSEHEAHQRAARQLDEVSAKDVFLTAELGPLPKIPMASEKPGLPPSIAGVASESSVDVDDLDFLAQATARRAWEMCSGIGTSGLTDEPYRDLVRRLAPLIGTDEFDRLCSRTKRIRSTLVTDAQRWLDDIGDV